MYKRRRFTRKPIKKMRVPRSIGTLQYTGMKSSANYGIRRSFQLVKALTLTTAPTGNEIFFFHQRLDISNALNNCPEFSDAAKAYKFIQIKNIRVNIHNFISNAQSATNAANSIALGANLPIAIAYQPTKDASYETPSTQPLTSYLSFDQLTLSGYASILGKSHSKLISFSPDSFTSQCLNTNGRVKEQITLNGSGNVSITPDNYGFLSFYYGYNGAGPQGSHVATAQIIFDVTVFDQ